MMEFYNHAFQTARKIHRCEFCSKHIKIGERYSYETGKWDGEFFVRKLCTPCYGMAAEYWCEVDNEFDWDQITDYLSEKYCWSCQHSINEDCNIMLPCECPKIREHYREDECNG